MKRLYLPALLIVFTFNFSQVFSQVGIGTESPNPKSVLELKSPGNNQGFLVPRLTTAQRTAMTGLSSSEKGLLVFDNDTNKFYYWGGSSWIVIEDSTGTDSQTLSFNPTTGLLSITGGNGINLGGITPGGTAGGDLTGTYPSPTVNNNAITSAKISDGTIVSGDLADGSVTSAKVLDGTLAATDLADGSVTSAKVLDGTITNTDINASAAIAVTKFAPGTSGQVLLTSGTTPTWSNMPAASGTAGGDLTGTYPNPTINLGAVVTNRIADGAVSTIKLLDGAVSSLKIQDATIAAIDIVDGAISTLKIADGAVSTVKLVDGAVSSLKIQDNTIATVDIVDGAISTLKIADNGVTAAKILNGAVTSAKVLDGDLGTADLADGAITSVKVLDGAITSAKVLDGAIVNADVSATAGIAISKFAAGTAGQLLLTIGTTPTWSGIGGDLTGSFPNPSIATGAGNNLLTAINNAATTGTINTAKLNTSVVLDTESPASGDVSGSFNGGIQINANAVSTSEIQDGSIGTADIAAAAITNAKIATGIDIAKLTAAPTDGFFLTTFLGNVTWAALPVLGLGTVTSVDTGPSLTGGPILTSGTIDLANNGVTTVKVLDDAITSTKLRDDATIDGNRAVTTNHIRDNAIVTSKISDGTIATADLADGAVSSLKITDLSIVNADVSATAAVAVSKLAGGATGNVLTTLATGVPTWQAPVDASATNEIQSLSITGTTLSISSGNSVTLPSGGGVGGSGTAGQLTYWSGSSTVAGDGNLLWDDKFSRLGVGIAPKTNLHLGGSHAAVFSVAKDGQHAVDTKDYIIICAPGTTDILLPDAADIPGRILYIRATDPKMVTIKSGSGKDTIDGVGAIQIGDRGDGTMYAVMVISLGVDKWVTLSRSIK